MKSDDQASWSARPAQWRNRYALVGTPAERAASEANSLREALYELLGAEPQSVDELHAGVLEHWGEATPKQVVRALQRLVQSQAVYRVGGGYVRRGE